MVATIVAVAAFCRGSDLDHPHCREQLQVMTTEQAADLLVLLEAIHLSIVILASVAVGQWIFVLLSSPDKDKQ